MKKIARAIISMGVVLAFAGCSWEVPQNVSVKTKADYNFSLGNYEKELVEMLIESFQNAHPVEPEIVSGDKVKTNTIPISWIENHIAWLEGLDNAFSTMTAIDIKVMVKRWREENERLSQEHEDARNE